MFCIEMTYYEGGDLQKTIQKGVQLTQTEVNSLYIHIDC